MLPTSAGVEPATSWSPVRRRIQLSHRGRLLQGVSNQLKRLFFIHSEGLYITELEHLESTVTFHGLGNFPVHELIQTSLACRRGKKSDLIINLTAGGRYVPLVSDVATMVTGAGITV